MKNGTKYLVPDNQLFIKYCGADGSRTRVQTRKQYAFYMLIFASIFVCRQDRSHQPTPYPLNFRQRCTTIFGYPRFFYTSIPNRFREWHSRDVPFRHLVPELSRSTKLQSSSESVIIFASYKFAVYDLSAIRQRTACLHTSSTCCQKPKQPHS
jgi:hypothetical protein